MSKSKKRRRNGKVITMKEERITLSKEAIRLINEGRANEIKDSTTGKIKRKYKNITTKRRGYY